MHGFIRISWFAAASVAGLLAAAQAQPVAGVPYSAEATTETSQTLADGSKVTHTVKQRRYRDREGRERRESLLDPETGRSADPQGTPTVVIVDPVGGFSYTLNVLQRTAVRLPIVSPRPIRENAGGFGGRIEITPAPGPAGAGAQVPEIVIQQGGHIEFSGPFGANSGPQRRTEALAPITIDGIRAEGSRTTDTIAANRAGNAEPFDIVTESWYSPELKVELMNRHGDPRTGEVILRLAKISREEPDHKLFEVPEGYTVQDFPSISGGILPGGVSVGIQPRQ
jgi:hypothetical protein